MKIMLVIFAMFAIFAVTPAIAKAQHSRLLLTTDLDTTIHLLDVHLLFDADFTSQGPYEAQPVF